MADHPSEEQQIEAFKRWWADNGLQTLAAVVLLIGGYFGWQYWQQQQLIQSEQASEVYLELIDIASTQTSGQPLSIEKQVVINKSADQLKQDYSHSGYAQFAALFKAKLAVESGELEAAANELQWALAQSPEPAVERLVRLRLARVEAARGNLESALQMVQGIDPAEMKSAYEEARGDFYHLQGDRAAAYTAYESALSSNQSQDPVVSNLLQLKISQVMPAQTPAVEELENTEDQATEASVQGENP